MKCITMVELAKLMGVSQEYIVRIETGDLNPTQEEKDGKVVVDILKFKSDLE